MVVVSDKNKQEKMKRSPLMASALSWCGFVLTFKLNTHVDFGRGFPLASPTNLTGPIVTRRLNTKLVCIVAYQACLLLCLETLP